MTNIRCIALMVVGFSGCVVTDVGNPQTDPQANVRLEGYEESDAEPGALVLRDGVELTNVWLTTDRLDLEPCDSDAAEDDGRLDRATDLLTGATFPGPVVLTKRETEFCRFRLDVRPLQGAELPDGAPAELEDHSVVMRGRTPDGASFVLRARFTERFELDGDIELRPEEPNPLVVGFALNTWMSASDLEGLPEPIVIDEETNVEVYDRFVESVKASAQLFEETVGGRVLAGPQ